MKHLIEAIKLREINQLNIEIEERYNLINEMEERLYLQMLYNEIEKLNLIKRNLQNNIPIQEEMF